MDVVTELTELEDEVDAAEGRTRAAPQFEAFPTDTASDLSNSRHEAFRSPGIKPTWSSSDKDFVTTALDGSRLWATVGHGGCRVQIRNRNGETLHASAVVSLDFSYLAYWGCAMPWIHACRIRCASSTTYSRWKRPPAPSITATTAMATVSTPMEGRSTVQASPLLAAAGR